MLYPSIRQILGTGFQEEVPAGGGGGGEKPAVKVPETFSREYVHELREENKSWRTKVQEAETARKAAEEAATKASAEAEGKVSDAGKAADAKVKETQSAADQRVIRAELKAIALNAGMIDLDGLKLADLSGVKLNTAGDVEGAEEMMAALKKAKPYLFKEPSSSNGDKPPPKPADQKPKKVSEMTEEERKAEAKRRGFKI